MMMAATSFCHSWYLGVNCRTIAWFKAFRALGRFSETVRVEPKLENCNGPSPPLAGAALLNAREATALELPRNLPLIMFCDIRLRKKRQKSCQTPNSTGPKPIRNDLSSRCFLFSSRPCCPQCPDVQHCQVCIKKFFKLCLFLRGVLVFVFFGQNEDECG